jgi:hypothetical protein
MSSRRTRPPRSRKSRSPEPPPAEISGVIPTTPPADMAIAEGRVETPTDELAAIDTAWDELLA